MRVVEDIPEPIYGFAMRPRLIAEYALDLSQRKRENCVAAVLQRRSNRLGTDKFAESHNRRGISEVTRRGQILPQQILRHLDGIGDYAIGTHEAKRARNSDILARALSLVVDTLDFNIYAITNLVCLAKDEACSAPTLDQQCLQSHGQIRGRSRREDQ